MENEKCSCESIKEANLNEIVGENSEIIFNINYLTEEIKQNIFGEEMSKEGNNIKPTCLIEVLGIQNSVLRDILNNLNIIMRTLKPNN